MNTKNYSKIAALLLVVGFALVLLGCNGKSSAPNKAASSVVHQEQTSDSARALVMPERFKPSNHFLERMEERGISVETAVTVIENGQRFYDPKHDSSIRWKDGIYVALASNGVLKTVIRGPIERRWRPQ